MTYVITRSCCSDASCIPVCPVNCIHPTPDEPDYGTTEMLYIDPKSCVDCGACVLACPVGAISADYDLTPAQAPYADISAHWFTGPGRRDYEENPELPWPRRWDDKAGEVLRVALVGSGPAAFYAAQELLSQRRIDVNVDMFERLLTPGGLVRFGVAPDHQDTKDAARSFAATTRRSGFRLFLNTEIGVDLTMEELHQRYHAVIVAAGALSDRELGIPGEQLRGSHSAAAFVGWYNGHPDFADLNFDLSSERAVIIGNGNVAFDVARILASDPDRLAKSDIADHALEKLRTSKIREVVVVGRRGPAEAAFTRKELLSLTQTPGVEVCVDPDDVSLDETSRDALGMADGSVPLSKVRMLTAIASKRPASAGRRVTLRFLSAPTEIVGRNRVEGVKFRRTRLVPN
ncbi:4Fe-4S binding protein [Nonomuraea sp. NPDC026600]|uniref:4Fe-4S binding protein n=1 Tax=Nonomuraea sp. NPDC026600 TaxID=3155363 RepID=UPI0033DCE60D